MDSLEQFAIVDRGGDATEKCVHAGLVTAAYLQARREDYYRRWKAVERGLCKKAGLPH